MNFIKKHKKLIIALVIILLLVIGVLFIVKYLSPNKGKDEYGNRLKGIEKVEITKETQNKFVKELEEKEKVSKASVNIKGRLINIIITLKEDVSRDSAKELANDSLDFFEEEELKYYDIQVYLKNEDSKDEDYPIIGYQHKTKEKLVWSNN